MIRVLSFFRSIPERLSEFWKKRIGKIIIACAALIVVASISVGAVAMNAQNKKAKTAKPQTPKTVEVAGAAVTAVTFAAGTSDTINLTTGGTQQLTATVSPDNALDKTITWVSSDAQTASIDNTGKITAIKAGDVTITATASTEAASYVLDIRKKSTGAPHGSGVTVGATEILEVTGIGNAVTWQSSDPALASVDTDGKVKALQSGEATLTAALATPASAQIKVHITNPAPVVTSSAGGKSSSSSSSSSSKKSTGGSGSSSTTGGGSDNGGGSGGGTSTPTTTPTVDTYWFDGYNGTLDQIKAQFGIQGYSLVTYTTSGGYQCAKVPSVGADSGDADQAALDLNSLFSQQSPDSMSNAKILSLRGKYYLAEKSSLFQGSGGLDSNIAEAEGTDLHIHF